MVTTVRLDEKRERILKEMTERLHKRKSEVLREALDFYAAHVLNTRKQRLLDAVEKVYEADIEEMEKWEGTLDDGL